MTSITKNEGSVTPRSSNFELMRIVLILMIIALHYFGYGGFSEGTRIKSFNYYLMDIVKACTVISVNVFIILTGYFSCFKKTVKISKPVFLYALSVFYGIIIAFVMIGWRNPTINWDLVQRFFPTIFYRWFVVYYCVLYLFIPYLNKLIGLLKKHQFEQLLILSIILFYGIDTFFPGTVQKDNGYGISNFVVLYCIGAYIRLYRPQSLRRTESMGLYAVGVCITSVLGCVVYAAWHYNTLMNLFGAIGFFEFFRSFNMKYHPVVNQLATYTFPTYIIHENVFMLWVFYLKWFHAPWFWNDKFLICNLVTCVIGIWVFCIIVEKIRRILLGKIMDQQIMHITKEIG